MVGIHWLQNTSFAHYAKPGINMFGYNQEEDHTRSSQLWLPGYFFDETARALTHEAIHEATCAGDSKCPAADGCSNALRRRLKRHSRNRPDASRCPSRARLRGRDFDSGRDRSHYTDEGVQSDKDVIRATGQRRLFD